MAWVFRPDQGIEVLPWRDSLSLQGSPDRRLAALVFQCQLGHGLTGRVTLSQDFALSGVEHTGLRPNLVPVASVATSAELIAIAGPPAGSSRARSHPTCRCSNPASSSRLSTSGARPHLNRLATYEQRRMIRPKRSTSRARSPLGSIAAALPIGMKCVMPLAAHCTLLRLMFN